MRLNRIVWEPDWSGRSLVPVLDSTHKLLVAKGQRSLLSVRPVAMFSSKEYLAKKTGPWGVGRFRYLQALVTEFQDTNKQEHKLQVLANLANFAYDPINYEHFRRLNILDLFLGRRGAVAVNTSRDYVSVSCSSMSASLAIFLAAVL